MTRRTIEIVAFCIALLIAAMSFHAWLSSRDEQKRLASTLASQEQLLDAADARESARQTALDATLAQIDALKRATLTPAQIIESLPKYLSLPQPITIDNAARSGTARSQHGPPAATQTGLPAASEEGSAVPPTSALPDSPTNGGTSQLSPTGTSQIPDRVSANNEPAPLSASTAKGSAATGAAQIPTADLKPLYDYVQDCRACQAQLAAARQNASDDAAKLAAVTNERDAAITAAKGGTFWHRLRRDALWFGVGAALGGAAAYANAKR